MTIYSKKACAPCIMLKTWLQRKNFNNYTEEPIEENIDKLTSLGFMSAPVVEIDGVYYNGSNISVVADALRKGGHLQDEQSTMAIA